MDPQKVGNVAGRITKQLQRGQRQTKQLNRFAHSADSPLAEFDGRQVIEEMVTLCERFARLRKVEIKGAVSGEPVPMQTDPFLLRQLVWVCLDRALAATAPGGCAEVGIAATEDGVRLQVQTREDGATAPESADGDEAAVLAVLVQALGGRVLYEPDPGQPFRLAVVLPQRVATQK